MHLQNKMVLSIMSEFITQSFSGRAYTSEEIVSFSNCPLTHLADIEQEMHFHKRVAHVQVSSLTQEEFDLFVREYADNYESIYFFQNPQVKDLSALASLHNVQYLLFYNMRSAKMLWDMQDNVSLKGIFISESKKLVYDISPISKAPALEELLLFSNMNRKYTVQTLDPIKQNLSLKRVMLECRTEHSNFEPSEFSHLEIFKYRVDNQRNYHY